MLLTLHKQNSFQCETALQGNLRSNMLNEKYIRVYFNERTRYIYYMKKNMSELELVIFQIRILHFLGVPTMKKPYTRTNSTSTLSMFCNSITH